MRILTVVGARPQFIKCSPVSKALREAGHTEVLLHTGQHYDHGMSQIFFDELGMTPPDINLEVGSGSHGLMTAGMLIGIEKAILEHQPDWVLIYGDTNSTVAGALAAAKLHVPIAHVEAGLRSFNRKMPEEINRIVADSISDLLLAPTQEAMAHLAREGVTSERARWVGDVMFDAALMFGQKADATSKILEELALEPGKFALMTIHRAENTDDPRRIQAIVEGMSRFAQDMPVIWPVHPRTRAVLETFESDALKNPDFRLVEPVGFLDMVKLEKAAALVVTDSGGVQKEAFFHQTPCVTLRDETEWVELVELGWNRLCSPSSADAVASAAREMLGVRGRDATPYGDGHAAQRIVSTLEQFQRGDSE